MKIVTNYITNISYSGKKEILIEITSELLKEHLAMNDKEKSYWNSKLNIMTEKEISNLLARLIIEPNQLIKFQKDKKQIDKNQREKKNTPFLAKNLKGYGISTISIKGQKKYKQGEFLNFSINTVGKVGYLYVILKSKKNTELLYPNITSPLCELSGKHKFPRDFGDFQIVAKKKCNSCAKEEITVYSILTKEPLSDIHELTKIELDNLIGIFSMKSNEKIDKDKINMYVGRIEFYVE